MSAEETVKSGLMKEFGIAEDKIRVPRPRRIFVEVSQADFGTIFSYARNALKFSHLVSITGFDEPEGLAFMYHLAHDNGAVLNIRFTVAKANPVIRSVTEEFPGADIYERELVDLFGAKVEGLGAGNRYPLADNWPVDEHPLRKDWKPGTKERAA